MATWGQETTTTDSEPSRWIQLKQAVRQLENRKGKSLRINLTTQPAETWDWSSDDVATVTVEEHRDTGRRRIVISEPTNER